MGYRYNAITGELDFVDTTTATGYIDQIDTDAGSALPVADIINIIGTAAQGVSTSGAGNTVTITIDDATAGASGLLATKGVSSFDSAYFTVASGFVTLSGSVGMESFLTDDGAPAVEPDGTGLTNILGTNGIITSGQGPGNTVTVTGINATIANLGVVTLATDAEVIDGTLTNNNAVNPSSLKAKLGVQTDGGILLGAGTASAITATAQPTNGQLLIGSTGVGPVLSALSDDFSTTVTNGAGSSTITISDNAKASAIHGWDGSLIESAAVTVASDGATITCSVQKAGGGNLTVITSAGYVTWVTAPDTVALTPGTDEVPVENFVYWLVSTATLTASTAGFPATEHAPIATVVCQTAATTAVNLAMKVHAWTDHTTSGDGQGHIGDLNHWIREQDATWKNAVTQTYSIVGAGLSSVTINTVAGVVLQLHDHTFPAFSAGHDYYVANDATTPYKIVTDLNALLTDSANVSMSGKFFTLVMWGVVSETAADCKVFINLPSGSYTSSSLVTADSSKYANFTIPAEYKGCGFLISQWNLKHSAAAGGTWTSIDEVDLRGLIPGVSAGSGTAASTQFPDTTFRIFDDGDSTKEIAFQADQITAATTRTLTVQDADGIIALSGVANYGTGAQTFTDHGVLVGSGTAAITATAVGATGELFTGVTGADPAFATSSNGDFTFTSSTAGATRALTVTNTDNTAVASSAALNLVVGGTTSTGDPFLHFLITGSTEYSFGIDNSDSDTLKITTGASPSAGTEILEIDSTSVRNHTRQFVTTHTVAGETASIYVLNTDNTDTESNAHLKAGVDAAGGDAYTQYEVASVVTWATGIDNSDSDKFKINQDNVGQATPSVGTEILTITQAGAINMPLQPAFLAFNSTADVNQTGNAAVATVDFDTEVYDQNADFAGDTFTAPVTGKYNLATSVRAQSITAAMTEGRVDIVTSNRTYRCGQASFGAARTVTDVYSVVATALADMDAADTAIVQLVISNGVGDTAGITGNASTLITYFSGNLEC